jgi:ABC-type multidrug transport system fused ATPase/permease subunit
METAKREELEAASPSQARQASSLAKRDAIQSEFGRGIAQLFGETKHFQRRIDDLHQKLSQIERTYASGDELFAPLRSFHTRLSQLAQSFASMRAFQFQLAQMAETFAPMKVLHNGLAEVTDSLEDHLAQLVLSLDPVRRFGERLRQLADTFDQAEQVQAEFLELHSTFRAAAKVTRSSVS